MSRKRIWIIEDDGKHCGEVSGSAMMLGNKCRGSGTGTAQTGTGTPKMEFNSGQAVPVPVPPYKKAPVAQRYRYHTNLYRYRHVRFAGIEQEYDSNARVRSSFNQQLEIIMERGIKAKGKVEKATFDF